MTAFVSSDLPASIDTLEKLETWVGLALQQINPTQTAIEGTGSAAPVAEFSTPQVKQENKTRLITRSSLEIKNDYLVLGGKIWDHVEELSSDPLPASFRDAA